MIKRKIPVPINTGDIIHALREVSMYDWLMGYITDDVVGWKVNTMAERDAFRRWCNKTKSNQAICEYIWPSTRRARRGRT